jgi:hypothetical protein
LLLWKLLIGRGWLFWLILCFFDFCFLSLLSLLMCYFIECLHFFGCLFCVFETVVNSS